MKRHGLIDRVSIGYMLIHAISLNIVGAWVSFQLTFPNVAIKIPNYNQLNGAANSLFASLRDYVIPAILIVLILHTITKKKSIVYYLIPVIASVPLGMAIDAAIKFLMHAPVSESNLYNLNFFFFDYVPSLFWFILGGILCIVAKYKKIGDKNMKKYSSKICVLSLLCLLFISVGSYVYASWNNSNINTEAFAIELKENFLDTQQNVRALDQNGNDITNNFLATISTFYKSKNWDGLYQYCTQNVKTMVGDTVVTQNSVVRDMDFTQITTQSIRQYCRWDGNLYPPEYYPGISQMSNNGYISFSIACSATYNSDTGAVTSVSQPYKTTAITPSGWRTELNYPQVINEDYSHTAYGKSTCDVTYSFTPSARFYIDSSAQATLSYYSESYRFTVKSI